ncbi:Lrp/AsnC family transcriptional regulator, partial [Candidatus Woesearchaeota archaeon]|nr:Lrp/AsnC family transcriptional regulator [Candidatus Woesearchaeota archaeon]
SKDATKYRIKRLEEQDTIKGYRAVIDTGKLGFTAYRLLIQFTSIPKQIEEEIKQHLIATPQLCWLVEVEGNWNLNMFFLCIEEKEIANIWNQLITKYGQYFKRRQLGIFSKVICYNRAYLKNTTEHEFSIETVSLPQEHNLDKHDWKIIELLAENARIPIIELAEKTGLTSKTIISRMKKLKKEVIPAYRVELNLEPLGYKYYKLHFMINADDATKEKIANEITSNPAIIYKDEVIGGYDIEVEIQVENEEELQKLIQEIKNKHSQHIRDYEILQYTKEHTLRFFPKNEPQ